MGQRNNYSHMCLEGVKHHHVQRGFTIERRFHGEIPSGLSSPYVLLNLGGRTWL